MKKRNLSFPGMVWMFSLFLTLLPFSVKAEEMRSFLRYAAILTRSGSSEASARLLPGHYATVINVQSANGWPIVTGKKVVLALPATSARPEALIVANNRKCLVNGSQPITSEAQLQIHIASDTRSRTPFPRRFIFSSRTVSSTCRQASTAHSLSG